MSSVDLHNSLTPNIFWHGVFIGNPPKLQYVNYTSTPIHPKSKSSQVLYAGLHHAEPMLIFV